VFFGLAHKLTRVFQKQTMASTKVSKKNEKKLTEHKKYYACERCGYVTIIRDSFCPICAKEGIKVKMK
jgi:rubrerythrin